MNHLVKLCLVLSMLFLSPLLRASELLNYEQAHQLYYQTLNNHALSSLEKAEQWLQVQQFLEKTPNFNLSALTLYKLTSMAIAQRNLELQQHWLEQLKQLNSEPQDPVVDFLMNKIQFDKYFYNNEFLQAIQLGTVLLEDKTEIKIDDIPADPIKALSLSSLEIVDIQNTLAKAYYLTGEYESANRLFLLALEGYEDTNNKKGIAHLFNNLSVIAWMQKDVQKALAYLEKGLAISKEIGDVKSIIAKLSNKGLYHTNLEQIQQAVDAFQQVLNHPQINNFPLLQINTLLALSEIHNNKKDYLVSESLINRALVLAINSNDLFSIANVRRNLAVVKTLTQDYDTSINLYLLALDYYQQKQLKKELATVLLALSEIYRELQSPAKALDYFTQYHQVYSDIQNETQQRSVAELQEKYDSKSRLEQIELLTRENELKSNQVKSTEAQKISQRFYGLAVFIIILLLVSRHYSNAKAKKLKQHNAEICQREEQLLLLSNAFKSTSDGVWIADENHTIIVVNNAFLRITGQIDSVGKKMKFAHVKGQDDRLTTNVLEKIIKQGFWQGEVFDEKASGEIYPIDLRIELIKNEKGEITHYLGVFRDISKRKKAETELRELATHDKLTGLPNRVLFKELIQHSILQYDKRKIVRVVLFLDVDGFKKLNDSLGHDKGDQFICMVAQRIVSTIKSTDVVARIGGDEFGILVALNSEDLNVASIANKIMNAFTQPFILDARTFKISVSIGVAVYPDDMEGENDAEELIRKSDLAMNVAKQSGKNNFSFYKQHMNEAVIALLDHEQRILDAIDNQHFEFHYQPIVNVATNTIVGAEALIRCREPNGHLIFPDDFISIAEKSGLIERIDEIVIDKVFTQINEWNKQNIKLKHVSINLSARIFSQADKLIALLESKLATNLISPSQVKIEITESMLIDNISQVILTMHRLKDLGFTLAIDDFGTGFSSLNYLKQFPVDVLKIDRTFIIDMHHSEKNKSIVRAIVDLSHNLGFSVTAEGVELAEHLDELNNLNCDEYQGYYFSRPLDIEAFNQLVINHTARQNSATT